MKDVASPSPLSEEPLQGSSSAAFARSIEHRRSRIVRGAAWFVLLICAALLGMNAWLIVRAHAAQVEQINRANTNLARSVRQQIEASISLAEHIIFGIAFELERADITPDALQRLQPVLVNHISQVRGIKGLFVYEEEGRWLVHSEPSNDAARNNSDRAYFIHHKSNQSARTHIGTPVVSRSSGEWVIPVSRRINAPDGSFAGVVLATLSIEQMLVSLEQFQIGRDGAIALFQGDQLLMRRPFREEDIGRQSSGSAIRDAFRAQRSGTVEGRSAIDGVERIISFERLSEYPLLVTVAVGREESLREWRTASIYQTIWVVILCGVVGAAGSYLVQSMQRRLKAESRLRSARNELARANERLGHLVHVDGLTGLANRRYFDLRLAAAFEHARSTQSPLAVVMVDVDDFKKFNDLYGHLQGDECLQQVARALRAVVGRSGDLVARYGGEEMVLLLSETGEEEATRLAQTARLAVLDLKVPHAATASGTVSISLGVCATVPQLNDVPARLLKGADKALYRAKSQGKNAVAT